jgi:nucleotide-binding universal stress UspA family protein
MKPIVLATDGSPSAAAAVAQSLEIASTLGSPLIAVSVEHGLQPGVGYYGSSDAISQLARAESARVERALEQACAAAAEAHVVCEPVHARGFAPEEICRVAKDRRARMIVIGAHGWGALRRMLHGSYSTAVVHDAACPVLVVPAPVAVAPKQERLKEAVRS